MVNRLKKWFRKQAFNPGFGGALVNPYYIARKALWNEIARNASFFKGGALLDIGCGDKPYHELFHVDRYIGIEVPVSGHDPLAKNADLFFDGKSLPFRSNSIDYIFCSEVLEHVFEPELFMKEIYRVLKEGGLLLLTVPFVWDEHEVPFDYCRYTSFGIRHLLEKKYFHILSQVKSGSSISCIFQLIGSQGATLLTSKNKYLCLLFNLLFIFPIISTGIILSSIFPVNQKLYLDNIVLARKDSI